MAASRWQLVVCGISHSTSELADREPLQINRDQMAEANTLLSRLPEVRESAILVTCNRVEFYVVADRSREPFEIVREFYHSFRELNIASVEEKFFTYKGTHVARHLFRVMAGIDSMVVGEKQIAGQVKDAYRSSCDVKAAGKIMHRLFHQAFRVGKAVRTDTEMGKGACSVASAAVSMIKSKVDDDSRPTVLFVGANQMIQLASLNMSRLHHGKFMFANRTSQKAKEFARRYHGEAYTLENLASVLPEADIVITCTASDQPIISADVLRESGAKRRGRGQIIMDMAVPRDVADVNGSVDSVRVFDLEDVKRFVAERAEAIEEEIPQAEEVIDRILAQFSYWYQHVIREPLYNGLEATFEDMRKEELSSALESLDAEQRAVIDKLTRRLVNRMAQLKIRLDSDTEKKSEN